MREALTKKRSNFYPSGSKYLIRCFDGEIKLGKYVLPSKCDYFTKARIIYWLERGTYVRLSWESIETATIGKTYPTLLFHENISDNPKKKIKEAKENRQPDGPIELTCTKMFPKRLIKVF